MNHVPPILFSPLPTSMARLIRQVPLFLFSFTSACAWSAQEREATGSAFPTGSHLQWVRTFYTTTDGLPSDEIRALAVTQDGIVLAAAGKAIAQLEENRWITQAGPSNVTALFGASREAEALAGPT